MVKWLGEHHALVVDKHHVLERWWYVNLTGGHGESDETLGEALGRLVLDVARKE